MNITRLLALSFLLVSAASAEVVRVEIESRADILGGKSFGLAGGYEKIWGTLHFEADPRNPANRIIVDVEHAPTNARGRVEYSSDFLLIKPKDIDRGNGTLLYDVSNRGSRRALTFFNHAHAEGETWDAVDPVEPVHFGDGLLMRNGFSVIWLGWQYDVPVNRRGAMRAYLPQTAEPIEGIVRSDFVTTELIYDRTLADRRHVPIPVADPEAPENVLTVRDTREGERRIVPRDQWAFARREGNRVVPDPTRVYLESGFIPDNIYEVVYKAERPHVIGLGLAAMRDAMSFFKYGTSEELGITESGIERAIGFGLSQPGRTLRTFLYYGFNEDEQQRKAFDGVMAHIAGASRGSFNLRFGQASRDAHPYLNFYYPTDIFPFTDVALTDPVTGKTAGLLDRIEPRFMPKIYNSYSSYEYWGRAASLLHTTPDGSADAPLPDNSRIYHFAGAQHLPDPFPPPVENGQNPNNPNDFSWMMRALLLAMNDWITHDTPAPPSVHPTTADGSLVRPEEVRFPDLPGVAFPKVPHKAYRLDFGPRFESDGIITQEPPVKGPEFPIMVPQVDADGNEVGGLIMPGVQMPLATYTGWNLYNDEHGPMDVISHMSGSYLPFARTRAERERRGDPRPSIEERYQNRAHYLGLVAEAALPLIEQGYLLDQDLPEILEQAAQKWDYHVQGR